MIQVKMNPDSWTMAQLQAAEEGFDLLRQYVQTKRHAVYHRRYGNIETARTLERMCDELYDKLPDWAKGW